MNWELNHNTKSNLLKKLRVTILSRPYLRKYAHNRRFFKYSFLDGNHPQPTCFIDQMISWWEWFLLGQRYCTEEIPSICVPIYKIWITRLEFLLNLSLDVCEECILTSMNWIWKYAIALFYMELQIFETVNRLVYEYTIV